jgi:hypothetical protein
MKRILQFSFLSACAAVVGFTGCSNTAAPGAGSRVRVFASHVSPAKTFSRHDRVVPNHVLTWAWIKSTDYVAPAPAAPYLNWAVVNNPDANAFSAAGIKTVLYSDPNRTYPGQPMFSNDETTFAHDCGGRRITINGRPGPTYQMDPHSPNLLALWTAWVNWELKGVHYDVIFDDDADSAHNTSALPCGFTQRDWSAASNLMNDSLGQTLVYNGLGTLADGITKPPPAIQLNPSSFGGLLEGCYGNILLTDPYPKKTVWQNYENTELTMAASHRMFVCRNLKETPAANSIPQRTYMYASFLLTYDPASSMISEKFSTPSHVEVEPESGLVALDPLIAAPADISGLSTSQYTYGRQYASCYLNGQAIGRCAAVVNADGPKHAHPFPWPGVYTHTLLLSGAGVLDGGTASVNGPAPGADIAGTSAEIAIQ